MEGSTENGGKDVLHGTITHFRPLFTTLSVCVCVYQISSSNIPLVLLWLIRRTFVSVVISDESRYNVDSRAGDKLVKI